MNTEEQIQQLMQQIRKLQTERDNTPSHQYQVIESITEDINYYQNQIDYLVNET
jgi:peptidoglycan hydrolase CwlO-like protein